MVNKRKTTRFSSGVSSGNGWKGLKPNDSWELLDYLLYAVFFTAERLGWIAQIEHLSTDRTFAVVNADLVTKYGSKDSAAKVNLDTRIDEVNIAQRPAFGLRYDIGRDEWRVFCSAVKAELKNQTEIWKKGTNDEQSKVVNQLLPSRTNENIKSESVHLSMNKRSNTGRPRNSDDEWAREQVHILGRNKEEVFLEWITRIGERGKVLADPRESFDKTIKKKPLEKKQKKGE